MRAITLAPDPFPSDDIPLPRRGRPDPAGRTMPARGKAARSRIRGAAAALGTLLAGLAWIAPASAGPDACQVDKSAGTALCSGNQGNGVVAGTDFPSQTQVLTVTNLTTPIFINGNSTSNPLSGISFQLSPQQSQFGVGVTFSTPDQYIFASNTGTARGVLLTSSGTQTGTARYLEADINGNVTANSSSTDSVGVLVSSNANAGAGGTGDGGRGQTGFDGFGSEVHLGGITPTDPASYPGIINATGLGRSISILASSRGGPGGGGASGFAYSGGTGGDGGYGGTAELTILNQYQFRTEGAGGTPSPGILLQAIGGNGGSGGTGDLVDGGRGGAGGQGGDIYFTGSVIVRTLSDNSAGVQLVSQAGNGGNGGSSGLAGGGGSGGPGGGGGSITATSPNSVIKTNYVQSPGFAAYSLGGTGGNGGNGGFFNGGSGNGGGTGPSGPVTVVVGGLIDTAGANSAGIVAQSIAGYAGSGGSTGGLVNFAAAGGSAGAGGPVAVTNTATIQTVSDQSPAISAQSIGGGGGNGGTGFGVFFSSGGTGGNGGDGGTVTIANTGALTTSGADANGLYAQSIGGAGGDGGSTGGLVAVGGRASYASNAGAVVVTNSGLIATGAAPPDGQPILPAATPICGVGCSVGILAQSIGGGGGNGGSSAGWFSVGGTGGGGGSGGAVAVANTGTIATHLTDSAGILAQSIGGGGGNGGGSGSVGPALAVAVGGKGGAGGNGGTVDVEASSGSRISTDGKNSPGISAQSIGGGGGSGGFAVAAALSPNSALALGVGGNGGVGGAGQRVTVNTVDPGYTGPRANAVATGGDSSPGILAQSIGGGGGNGGFALSVSGTAQGLATAFAIGGNGAAGGAGGPVGVTSDAAVTTAGTSATGILAQSVGGGGGNGGLSIAGTLNLNGAGIVFSAGGQGAAGGAASPVTLTNTGTVSTAGAQADGLAAQSIGGGGGNGGITIAANLTTGTSGGLAVSLGANGGTGGNAAAVALTNGGAVTTSGASARALVAESTGGGGGNGGLTLSGSFSGNDPKQMAIAVGGSGGAAGDGGGVTVVNTGALRTNAAGNDPGASHETQGILAASTGGGGGTGSWTGALTLGLGGSSGEDLPVNASLALGATGGAGGNGGQVGVQNSGSIATAAAQSPAIEATSLGGGGGDAGYVLSANGSAGAEYAIGASIAVGRSGGAGGSGGKVSVANTADLTTAGDQSPAIAAQSIGGGGGTGGALLALTGTSAQTPASFNLAVGGAGGNASRADTVTVTSAGLLATSGSGSVGILATSTGGTGGNGAITLAGTATLSKGYSAEITVGGNGGSGGSAGAVTVTSDSAIATLGDAAHGIQAQSTGGGGGNASLSAAAALRAQAKVDVTVGGFGGSGNDGAAVNVTSRGPITVTGAGSVGILAQSIGGGGGNSQATSVGTGFASTSDDGFAGSFKVQVGNTGAGGGNAGTVTVLNTAAIATGNPAGTPDPGNAVPTEAYGILAQSIGGGGGAGGNAISLVPGLTGQGTNLNMSVNVGGQGGAGGIGAAVSVTNQGPIATLDPDSHGIFAQSVGGGGGKGGAAASLAGVLLDKSNTMNIAIAVGGAGGSGNVPDTVTVANSGAIATRGAGAHGILAQSIGGGGGDGGSAFGYTIGLNTAPQAVLNLSVAVGGNGGAAASGAAVTVTNGATITTAGDGANGIQAQSVGGGGGDGGSASRLTTFPLKTLSVLVGGSGGATGDGGPVTVQHGGGATIATSGSGAVGIYAQSVGGGGGRGGAGVQAAAGAIALGGQGGSNGNGGTVLVQVQGGAITTQGTGEAYGIFAQSIGGGGGEAGGVGLGIIDTPYGAPPPGYIGTVLPTGAGSSSGNGGPVTVSLAGTLATHGDDAIGIFAQSVGGGGGLTGRIGDPATCPAGSCSYVVGSAGGTGAAGAVGVTLDGAIATSGQYSHGIFAQSAAGTGSASGDVTVSVAAGASIQAGGNDAHAIFAQSVGGAGNGKIAVTVGANALVQGGSGDAAGVRFLDGAANTLDNAGTITTVAGVNGEAVRADGGTVAITNTGTLIGSVDVNGAPGTLLNAPQALFAPGPTVNLGAGGTLTNQGTVTPGGQQIGTTRITGNYVQTPTGTLALDLSPGGGGRSARIDRLDVTGSAQVAGAVTVRLLDLGQGGQGRQTLAFLTAGQGVSTSSLSVTPSVVAQYQVQAPSSGTLAISYDIDFANAAALSGLDGAGRSTAGYIQALYAAYGIPPSLQSLVQAGSAQQYRSILQHLSAEPYAATIWTTALSALQFTDGMLACRGMVAAQPLAEGDCFVLDTQGRLFTRDASAENVGYHVSTAQAAIGLQRRLGGGWLAGFRMSYEHADTGAQDDLWRASEDQFTFGLVGKRQLGATTLAASVLGGFGSPDVQRSTVLQSAARGKPGIWFAGGSLHVDHAFAFGSWYVKPRADFDAIHVSQGGASESGPGVDFRVLHGDTSYFSVRPAVEVGGDVAAWPGTLVRPSMSVGLVQFLSDPSPTAQATLEGMPEAGVAPLTVKSHVDRSFAELRIGLDLVTARGATVSVNGFGDFGATSVQAGGGIGMKLPF